MPDYHAIVAQADDDEPDYDGVEEYEEDGEDDDEEGDEEEEETWQVAGRAAEPRLDFVRLNSL